ncbi:MAG: citrate/2-methylcitrate synthase [Bacillota bacterium]|nr:citrate/2-methylcitrate synthase [Bacillota bacterium]
MADTGFAPSWLLFDRSTRAIIYGYQAQAVQGMLDFDYVCRRDRPSVACIVNPTRGGTHLAFWGSRPLPVPMYQSLAEAVARHPEASVLVNFASARSAYGVTAEALAHPCFRVVAVIAEGVPERRSRELIAMARERGTTLIGPATVGGIKAGAFKIGNAGGTLENIVESRLCRPGHVAYVSRSGGLSNELNNIIARNTDGVYEGIALGGDRHAGSTYIDHILRYERDPEVAMIVLLGEIGGTDEYEVADALRAGRITKPLVAWCIGTSAGLFSAGVQFGHAGARADAQRETARAKNEALRAAGAVVPASFEDFDRSIAETYCRLVAAGKFAPAADVQPPPIPMDFGAAVRAGVVRRAPAFVSSIADDRGEELAYAGLPISEVIERGLGVGGVIGLLWFKRELPAWACRFIELVLQVAADHGPAVSGAHNTIVAARAGKDIVSSVASGLLTVGPRFGGAIEGAASVFRRAVKDGQPAGELVAAMRAKGEPIPGIGHLAKSVTNPDRRVELLKSFSAQHFPATPHLEYALAVERLTTAKRDNLILNVDGCIGALFLDLLQSSGLFCAAEIDEVADGGMLNGLFLLSRTIGLIGHFMDQRRLRAPLYRHPWDDIAYLAPDRHEP